MYTANDCEAIYQIIVKTHISEPHLLITSTNSSTTITFNNPIVTIRNKLSTSIH